MKYHAQFIGGPYDGQFRDTDCEIIRVPLPDKRVTRNIWTIGPYREAIRYGEYVKEVGSNRFLWSEYKL